MFHLCSAGRGAEFYVEHLRARELDSYVGTTYGQTVKNNSVVALFATHFGAIFVTPLAR